MSEARDGPDAKPVRKGKGRILLVAFVLALVAGGGGFYGVYSGLLYLPLLDAGKLTQAAAGGGHGGEETGHAPLASQFEPGAFVHLDPLIISLGAQSRSEHLKVTLAVEVRPEDEEMVVAVKPRIIDVLNGFLRAVDEREFELPRSMERLRAQMLRRVRLVTPEGSVRDLLIQEFLLD
jgi:flagellar FliL protein